MATQQYNKTEEYIFSSSLITTRNGKWLLKFLFYKIKKNVKKYCVQLNLGKNYLWCLNKKVWKNRDLIKDGGTFHFSFLYLYFLLKEPQHNVVMTTKCETNFSIADARKKPFRMENFPNIITLENLFFADYLFQQEEKKFEVAHGER